MATGILVTVIAIWSAPQDTGAPLPPQNPPASRLEDVVVRGEIPEIFSRIDRRVFNIEADELSQSSTALEILARLPSVSVNGPAVSILGQGSATVLVDGAVPSNREVLRTLIGPDISRIEVISTPSAEFRAQGTSGIINIITRRNREIGVSGAVIVTSDSTRSARLNASPSIAAGHWTVGAPVSLDKSRSRQNTRSLIRVDQQPDQTRTVALRQSSDTWSIGVNAVRNLERAGSLSLTGSLNGTDSLNRSTERAEFGPDVVDYTTSTRGDVSGGDVRIAYDYSTPDDRRRLELSAGVTSNSLTIMDRYRQASTSLIEPTRDSLLLNQDDGASINLSYEMKIDGSKLLRTGAQFERSRQSIAQQRNFEEDFDVGDWRQVGRIKAQRDLYSVFGTWEMPIGEWTVQSGLRFEHDAISFDLPSQVQSESIDIFPSLHARYQSESGHSFNLSYSRRINRPDFARLDPTLIFYSPSEAGRGNPELQPELTGAAEFRVEKSEAGNVSALTAYLRRTVDVWRPGAEFSPDGLLIRTTVNGGVQTNAGIELLLRRALSENLKVTGSLNLYRSRRLLSRESVASIETVDLFSGSMTTEFKPLGADPTSDTFQLSARFSGAERNFRSSNSGSFNIDASWRRPLTARLSSVLSVTRLLGTSRGRSRLFGDGFTQALDADIEGPSLRWTLSYRLGTDD